MQATTTTPSPTPDPHSSSHRLVRALAPASRRDPIFKPPCKNFRFCSPTPSPAAPLCPSLNATLTRTEPYPDLFRLQIARRLGGRERTPGCAPEGAHRGPAFPSGRRVSPGATAPGTASGFPASGCFHSSQPEGTLVSPTGLQRTLVADDRLTASTFPSSLSLRSFRNGSGARVGGAARSRRGSGPGGLPPRLKPHLVAPAL